MGGTGYGAGELLRLLAEHPYAEVACVTSQSAQAKLVTAKHPHLNGFYANLQFCDKLDLSTLEHFKNKVVFSALPHGTSGAVIKKLYPSLIEQNVKLVDLSGDFRLENIEQSKNYYPEAPLDSKLREQFAYGLPEISIDSQTKARELISSSQFVANPGCLASASILSALPLIELGLGSNIVFDAKTGSSGSGKAPKSSTHHPYRNSNFTAYKPLCHQHEPEIMQALGDSMQQRTSCSFVAHSLPVSRGIYTSTHLELNKKKSQLELQQHFQHYYQSCPFIRVVDNPPSLVNVVGTNYCDIAIFTKGPRVVVFSALDNLVKGMAGQAIQNMNLMFGIDETLGLKKPALGLL